MTRWTTIRVPEHLADRLRRLCREFEASYGEGHTPLPDAVCEQVPAWYVIRRALDVLEFHRERGRTKRPPESPRSAQDRAGDLAGDDALVASVRS